MTTRTETLTIDGMTCAHCVRAVHEALERAGAEVESVRVGEARARVRDDVPRDALVAAVEGEGYGVVG